MIQLSILTPIEDLLTWALEPSLAMAISGRAGFAGAAVCNDRSTRSVRRSA
jgi:hypothetical protein